MDVVVFASAEPHRVLETFELTKENWLEIRRWLKAKRKVIPPVASGQTKTGTEVK